MANTDPFEVDSERYRRFSTHHQAFGVLARQRAEPWPAEMAGRRRELIARGCSAPKKPLCDPQDAQLQDALRVGYGALNATMRPYLDITSTQSAWLWEVPSQALTDDPGHRLTGERLTTELKRFAKSCGAALVGVTSLDERWIYSDVGYRDPGTGEEVRRQVCIAPEGGCGDDTSVLHLPAELSRVIVVAVPMEREMVRTAPSLLAEAATGLGYSRACQCVLSLAHYLHALGYRALPSLNDTGLTVPMAIQAGLGELGRNGMLVTAERGPCVRLAKVFTDMPLCLETPVDRGIGRYCHGCTECARACPAQAISYGDPVWEGHNESNNNAVLKWPVDAQQCLRYWVASGSSCSACIANCPYTLGRGWWGGIPQWLIQHAPSLNGVIARLDRRSAGRKARRADGVLLAGRL